jgi:hypothetical protein
MVGYLSQNIHQGNKYLINWINYLCDMVVNRLEAVKVKYRFLIGFCLIFLGFLSCEQLKENDDHETYKSIGIITGPDFRLCPSPCCGGWFIKIDSLTYEFDFLPANSDINLQKETFPLVVKLDWQLSNTIQCPDRRITIQKIARE